MNQLSHTATVRAPLARVWETLADVGTIADWHLGVDKSPVLSKRSSGMGATRRVELYDGNSSVEEVTSLEEGRSLTVTMSEHTMPMSHFTATFLAEADGEGQTQVTMTMAYKMKYGPLGWLMNVAMLRGILRKLLVSILAGLDHHLVTGEIIGKGWEPASK